MKNTFCAFFLLFSVIAFSQKPCEIETNVQDSLGTYKATKQYIIYEKNFAGKSTDIFFSLTNSNGILGVEVQILQRSGEFIKATCFDPNSKIYLQLNNGKIVTLIYGGNDTCGTLLRDEKSGNSRVLGGSFVFAKENYEELKNAPVTFMRIKYAGEIVDYPFKTEIISELNQKKYQPENFFMDYLKCVEN